MRISDWSSDVCSSDLEIPFPYVLDGDHGAAMAGLAAQDIARHFPATDLALIGDELADGSDFDFPESDLPLALFDGQLGRASCRERVWQYVSISVVAVPVKNKK